MTQDTFRSVLDSINAKADDDGNLRLPEGQLMTLYAAHDGVQLTIAKVEWVRVTDGHIRAKTAKGEQFFVAREDLFAISVDGGTQVQSGRKAGFLG